MTAWIRENLFRSRWDGLVTIVVGSITAYALFRFARFVFVTGRWEIVEVNLSLYMKGVWPDGQLWRLVVAVISAAFLGGAVAGYVGKAQQEAAGLPPARPSPRERVVALSGRLWPLAIAIVLLLVLSSTIGPWLLLGVTVLAVVLGHVVGRLLPYRSPGTLAAVGVLLALGVVWFMANGVGLDGWGGMLLNVFLAAFSITLCFPLGVLLALGRRSQMPIVRALATGYIELFRGVPLIALLLMANVALGFFVPQSLAPSDPVRAIVVFVLFTAAYMAEIVRGGLQSVPTGQIEAAKALGMSPVSTTFRIVLPQALRNVIPAIVGQFISLFKDTTLAGAAMGLTDLLVAAQASTAQEAFQAQGLIVEALVFVLFLFWVGSYTMSRESQRLESRLGVGER